MKWGDKLKETVRTWLNIEPAPGGAINIREQFTFEGNAAKNMIWYRGDAFELNQLYHAVPCETEMFWAAVPTEGLNIRKLHTGLPKIIVDTLANIIIADLNKIGIEDAGKAETWEAIANENNFNDTVRKAIVDALVIGDGAFKISIDTDLSELPIIEWFGGDRVEYETRRGRIVGVVFKTPYKRNGVQYELRERYTYGLVEPHLYNGGKECSLSDVPELAALQPVTFDTSFMMAVPFMITKSVQYKGRGASVYDAKCDAFDALDECYSQWWQAMRECRPSKYIPDSLIPRNAETGELMRPNAFDNQFVTIGTDMSERAANQVTLTQPEYDAAEYNTTYITALDLALQGLVSPSTLGIDVKKLDNAEAQREKEKATLYTRQRVIEAITPVLQGVVSAALKSLETLHNEALTDTECTVEFGEYANPSFEAVVQTLSNPNTPMSIEAKVEEMWGDTKDDDWKAQEVQRIKEQNGIVSMDEPAVNLGLGASGVQL